MLLGQPCWQAATKKKKVQNLNSPCPYSGPASILSLLDQHTTSSLFSLLPAKSLQSAPYTQPEGACDTRLSRCFSFG